MGRACSGRIESCLVTVVALLLITGATALAQNLPDAPQPQTIQSSSQQQNPESSKSAGNQAEKMTVEAAKATIHMGEAAMVKARNWESSWVTGVYIEKNRTMLPLTFEERRELYLTQTLTTPGAYLKRMFAAGIDQARDSPPQWEEGIGGYGERFASREGQFISANTLAFLGNAALGYEPRYDQCQCSGLWPRARHAILRNFVTYNHSEQELRPQLGLYAGSFFGGMISTAWKPEPRNAFAEGGRAVLGQAAYGTLLNLFIEFAGDINHKIGADRKQPMK
ncbi:MAG TPA: hypothetical protein VGS78_04445 [Candidatus Sulfotelmatobacter sp.]|nr:hypothetical protein [Candidatus Sulfotelmatobacter sp.]